MIRSENLPLRAARETDVEGIATVFALSCASAYRDIFPSDLLANYVPAKQVSVWADRLTNLSVDHHVIVAAKCSQVIGFIQVGPAASIFDRGQNFGEVHYLFVHPDHVRYGVGSDLLLYGENLMAGEGYAEALLWVLRDNIPARSFYEQAGWNPTGTEQIEPDLATRGDFIVECKYSRVPRTY